MPETLATALAAALGIYLAIGVPFGLWFAARGCGRVDPVAGAGTWGFRVLLFPASAALWPVLLARTRR